MIHSRTEVGYSPLPHAAGNFIFSPWPRTYSLCRGCYFTCWLLDVSLGLPVRIRNIDRPPCGAARWVPAVSCKTSAEYNVTGAYNHAWLNYSIQGRARRRVRGPCKETTHIPRLANYALRNRPSLSGIITTVRIWD